MSILKEKLIEAQRKNEAILLNSERETKTRKEYIENAEEGLIVAFRINYFSKQEVAIKKTISGKIITNDKEQSILVVETRNGLQYAVPYDTVLWVKTGDRWPKGVYEEMKRGAVAADESDEIENSSIDDAEFEYSNENVN